MTPHSKCQAPAHGSESELRRTIAAIATPLGTGGIGIVRISGSEALSILQTLFLPAHARRQPERGSALSLVLKSHHLYYGHIIDPESRSVLDEVLAVYMAGPRSFTREDVVEIHAHSGPLVLSAILKLVLKFGATLAGPGEFTRRAFLSGRIDLSQAEAVIELIGAKSEKSLRMASAHLCGRFKEAIEAVRASVMERLVEIEAGIDFPDDLEEPAAVVSLASEIEETIGGPLHRLAERYEDGRVFREGVKLGVVGRPNVGKSSLMNRLLERDRVIVAASPGTTRDLIEEPLTIQGLPVVLADTAGLHETQDPVEAIGIQKTRDCIGRSDLVLFVVEAQTPVSEGDRRIFRELDGKKSLIVVNKVDLMAEGQAVVFPEEWRSSPWVSVSALFGTGIEDLKTRIVETAAGQDPIDPGTELIPNFRQKEKIDAALAAVHRGIDCLRAGGQLELVAMDLEVARKEIDAILGEGTRADILDGIFDRFCIGK